MTLLQEVVGPEGNQSVLAIVGAFALVTMQLISSNRIKMLNLKPMNIKLASQITLLREVVGPVGHQAVLAFVLDPALKTMQLMSSSRNKMMHLKPMNINLASQMTLLREVVGSVGHQAVLAFVLEPALVTMLLIVCCPNQLIINKSMLNWLVLTGFSFVNRISNPALLLLFVLHMMLRTIRGFKMYSMLEEIDHC